MPQNISDSDVPERDAGGNQGEAGNEKRYRDNEYKYIYKYL